MTFDTRYLMLDSNNDAVEIIIFTLTHDHVLGTCDVILDSMCTICSTKTTVETFK
jgi:hypothetical protein